MMYGKLSKSELRRELRKHRNLSRMLGRSIRSYYDKNQEFQESLETTKGELQALRENDQRRNLSIYTLCFLGIFAWSCGITTVVCYYVW